MSTNLFMNLFRVMAAVKSDSINAITWIDYQLFLLNKTTQTFEIYHRIS